VHSAKTADELVFRPQVRRAPRSTCLPAPNVIQEAAHECRVLSPVLSPTQVLELAGRFPGRLHAAYFATRHDGSGGEDDDVAAPSASREAYSLAAAAAAAAGSRVVRGRIDRESLRHALEFAAADKDRWTSEAPTTTSAAGTLPAVQDAAGQEQLDVVAGGPPAPPPEVYLCGPPQFLRDLEQVLVAELGVRPEHVHFERWW
jgi:hypothetical protein